MPYGYSLFDFLWNRNRKKEILKKISKKELKIWAFFHNLIFVSLYTTVFVSITYLIIYGRVKEDAYILLIIALFSPFVTQSIIRKFFYIKYGYYKNIFSKSFGILGSVLLLFSFILIMIEISNKISMPLVQTFKYFLIEYMGLIVIGLIFLRIK